MINSLIKIVAYAGLTMVCGILLTHNFGLYINLSESTQYKFFLVHKRAIPEHVGEYIVFDAVNNGKYDSLFVKQVGGVAGDKVTRDNRSYYVNNLYIGDAKTHSKEGKKANLGPVGVIPSGQYFVYLNHGDSYDSRYAEIGWIDSRYVRGVAYPIY